MDRKVDRAESVLFRKVLALVKQRIPAAQVAHVEIFARQFYQQVDPDDLHNRDPADLFGAVLSLWSLAQHRDPDKIKLLILNPREDEHGWQCPHTVIEIVNRDMPFLVDSVRMEVNAQGFTTHLIIHPVIGVVRDSVGKLVDVQRSVAEENVRPESCMYLEIDQETDAAELERLESGLRRVLGDVRVAVDDWTPMSQRMRETAESIIKQPLPLPAGEVSEGAAFLHWLTNNHFTYLGARDYDLLREDGDDVLRIVTGSGLGILREKPDVETSTHFATLPTEIRELARKPELLIITKSNSRATVHRPGYMDYIGVKRFDDAGNVCGERRFVGLYTSPAYSMSALEIPLLKRKIGKVVDNAGVSTNSHLQKALLAILESYPRDELFQINEDDLSHIAMGILHLQERQCTRLFVRRDPFGRYFSCLIYTPRDNYNSDVRQRMQLSLVQALEGITSTFTVDISESVLARLLIVVSTKPGARPDYDVRALEAELARIARRWQDDLASALIERFEEERGRDLYRLYGNAFPVGYREHYTPHDSVYDVDLMESLTTEDGISMNLYKPVEMQPGELRFKLLKRSSTVPLWQSLPMLEHMGVKVIDEHRFELQPSSGKSIWVHDMGLRADTGIDIDVVRSIFHDTFLHVWRGAAESDNFNRLVLRAGLTWREIALLRAYVKYARQTGFTFSQAYMEAALCAHPSIARQLVSLFIERNDPDYDEPADSRGKKLEQQVSEAIDEVVSLDEDRILRQLLALITATTRTNYFQHGKDGAAKPYLSLKFDPSLVPGLPEPLPLFEIYVYSPRVEGVHLRGGRAARGGLRWSDRMEDFRTEVLGLMKAQMVKNAVIVPVGAKGGFVVKSPPAGADRATLMKEVVYCYTTFLRGLLDLTGNSVLGKVVPPTRVVRHDEDSTYLVVAADKGTATFSDIANGVAAEYGFWMGDAFASGGSNGYDHKKMGITARGAWESVKKHFRTLGKNIQTTDFSVVGIGDMSGDVFGNGMLLTRHTRLLAAFDHRHIFIDPDPDIEKSFAERARMFSLPRSSWMDYDQKLISKGGGVYARTAKSITLSAQARQVLGIDAKALPPNDVIRAILLAPVELLYNGGIGTYVKSSQETHADVGDRSNDGVRVDGAELRCRVVGEGGNLGFTQRGRVEFALKDGLIHTDAIDNSAGVDCSDHEVNIKILLNGVMADGKLTEKQRNRLLVQMTDEVAALVLRDNTYQAQSLAVSGARGVTLLEAQAGFIRYLEHEGMLKREIEFLPSDEEIVARKAERIGLTTPERSVLLAYGKIWLCKELLSSKVVEDPFIATALERYFPTALCKRFRDAIYCHPLRREIVATHVCNNMINRVGSTFVHELMEQTGARPSDVVRAYLMTHQIFRLVHTWDEIEALDDEVEHHIQMSMLIRLQQLTARATQWFLRRRLFEEDIEAVISRFADPVDNVIVALDSLLGKDEFESVGQSAKELTQAGVPAALARRVASADLAHAALDIIELAQSCERAVPCVADVFFSLTAKLNLSWLREQIKLLPSDSHWQTLAQAALADELAQLLRTLTNNILGRNPDITKPDALIAAWEESNRSPLERTHQVLAEVRMVSSPDLAILSVALRELRNLI